MVFGQMVFTIVQFLVTLVEFVLLEKSVHPSDRWSLRKRAGRIKLDFYY